MPKEMEISGAPLESASENPAIIDTVIKSQLPILARWGVDYLSENLDEGGTIRTRAFLRIISRALQLVPLKFAPEAPVFLMRKAS